MKEKGIEHLAYMLKDASEKKLPQPIFFLGAGASRTGNIPLASEIIEQILIEYIDSPSINDIPTEERTYAKLMDCLLPAQRAELLKRYIDKAKINVTHIYLAQLINEGFVDYVLTVNFDNLMLRALALYNIFPATYDMAILNDLTTTTFKEKSVVYLHGQSHGLWLLNTQEEMDKVKTILPRIFDTIKNKRPWVFIGYSGEDQVFDYIKDLGRFDNGLYWVCYNENIPNENVQKFLSEPNTNAFLIKGFDSDSFMLKLNSELGLGQPNIINMPFTALKETLYQIVDIDDKEHFRGVKERLIISKRQVKEAIRQFELGEIKSSIEVEKNNIDLLKKEIINLIVSNKYDGKVIKHIEMRAKEISDDSLQNLLIRLYLNWGIYLGDMAMNQEGKEAEKLLLESIDKYQKVIEIRPDNEEVFSNLGAHLGMLANIKKGNEAEALCHLSIEKLQKAIEIKPDNEKAFSNWGVCLLYLANTKEGKEAEKLYHQSIEKFQKANEIKPDSYETCINWGSVLSKLAIFKGGKEQEEMYLESIEKLQKAIEIKPNSHEAYYNCGTALAMLAISKKGKEQEVLYHHSFEKFQKAIEIKPDCHEAYYNWGTYLGNLAETKEGEEAEVLFHQSFEKYQKAIEIKPKKIEAYQNWADDLSYLASIKKGKEAEALYQQSFEKYQKVIELGGKCYNLGCLHALKENTSDALFYLDLSLKNKEISVHFVENDDDWKKYSSDLGFTNILNKHRK